MDGNLARRSRRVLGLGLGLGALFAPPASVAREVILGVSTSGQYDSNVFAQPDAQDDFSVRLGPIFELRDQTGDLTYSLRYTPSYQWYADFNQLDDWEHYVFGRLGWRIGPSTTLNLTDTFYDTNSARRAVELLGSSPGAATDTVPVTIIGADRYQSNIAGADLTHLFTARTMGELSVGYTTNRQELASQANTDVATAQGNLTYALSPVDRIGAGYGLTYQRILKSEFRPESKAWYHNVFGIWNHDFSPTWNVRLQAGPTLVQTADQPVATVGVVNRYPLFQGGDVVAFLDTTTCDRIGGVIVSSGCSALSPAFGGDLANDLRTSFVAFPIQNVNTHTGGNEITYFADLELTKTWETVDGSISYRRSAGTSSGLGTNTTDDTVRASVTWRPDRDWTFNFLALWDRQESVGNGQVNVITMTDWITAFASGAPINQVDLNIARSAFFNGFDLSRIGRATGVLATSVKSLTDVQRWIATAYAERRIWRGLVGFGRASFTYQTNTISGFVSNRSSYNSVRVELGMRYEFDPIQF